MSGTIIWPTRRDLRDRLLEVGVPYLDADLLATLTQGGKRPDLADRVCSELGWHRLVHEGAES